MENRLASFCFLIVLLLSTAAYSQEDRWKYLGLPSGEVQQLITDRKHPGIEYALVDGNFYRSTNTGRSWQKSKLPGDPYLQLPWCLKKCLSVHPVSSELYVITKIGKPGLYGVWASRNFGRSFELRSKVGPVYQVIGHPMQAETLFGFGIGPTMSVSNNGGRSWQPYTFVKFGTNLMDSGPACYLDNYYFAGIAVSPLDEREMYTSALLECSGNRYYDYKSYLFGSTDRGKHWRTIRIDESPFYFIQDPVSPHVLAYNPKEIRELTTTGWQKTGKLPFEPFFMTLDLLLSIPHAPGNLLAVNLGSGYPQTTFYRSRDFGNTWRKLELSFGSQLRDIIALDSTPNLLAGSFGGFYRTHAGRWLRSSAGLQGGAGFLLASKDWLYAFAGSFCRTTNGGATWQDLTLRLPLTSTRSAAAINPRDPKNLILSQETGSAVNNTFATTNGGMTWKSFPGSFSVIAFDPSHPQTIYFNDPVSDIDPDVLYKSTDAGLTLTPLSFAARNGVKQILVDEYNSNRLFVLDENLVYSSEDGGASFHAVVSGLPKTTPPYEAYDPVEIRPLNSPGAFLLLTYYGIYRSDNAGNSWFLLSRRNQGVKLRSNGTGTHIFVSTRQHLWESQDSGKTWRDIIAEVDPAARLDRIVWDLTDPRTTAFYIATSSTITTPVAHK